MDDLTGTFDVFHNVENDILAFILGSFILILALVYMFKAEIKEWIQSRRRGKKKIYALKYHDVFNTLKRVVKIVEDIELKTKSRNILYDDCVKTKVMHILIEKKCQQVDASLTEFLKRESIESYDTSKLKSEVKTLLQDLVEKYNKEAINEMVGIGIKRVDAVYAVETYEKFRTPLVNGFVERVDSIVVNTDYYTNYEKISAILEVIALSLYLIPKDVQDVFEQINGRFLKYDGNDVNL